MKLIFWTVTMYASLFASLIAANVKNDFWWYVFASLSILSLCQMWRNEK